jgi:hypothetical protein
MLTLNLILKEIKDVPVDRLEEVYEIVHSLALKSKPSESKRKKTMSLAGCLADMSEEDYRDFENHLKQTRKELFNRKIDL